MAKVLFVTPPHARFDEDLRPKSTFSTFRVPYMGVLSLASYLRINGHECKIIDGERIAVRCGNVRSAVYFEILEQARNFKPDFVYITILTAEFYECKNIIERLCKLLPSTKIVAGGPHPSGEPHYTLKQISELEGIGIGPGEEICLDLTNGQRIEETEGCAYFQGEDSVFVSRRDIRANLDSYSFPAWDLIDGEYYSELNFATVSGILCRSLPLL